jgi:hypothetical protein
MPAWISMFAKRGAMMSERHPIRATFALLRGLFLVACVAIAVFAIVGYASGWITFQHDVDKATIEIKTDEIQKSADDAWKKGEELMEDAEQKLQPADEGSSAPVTDGANAGNDEDGSTPNDAKVPRPNEGLDEGLDDKPPSR